MFKIIKRLNIVFACVVFLPTVGQTASDYPFPVHEKYAATVVGTPLEYKAVLPKSIPVKEMHIDSIRKLPDYFWHQQGLTFSAAIQPGPAPVIFNIGGTGAAYNSSKLIVIQKALYQAGFSVINLSSPTHFNFQLNASTSAIPGYVPDDITDLYRVMQQAYALVQDDIQATAFHVTGYSLGAMHAAFVAERDSREKVFDLQKVYMINPPVNLKRSVSLLDNLLVENIDGGIDGIGDFLTKTLRELSETYLPEEGMRFDGDFLYNAYTHFQEDDTGTQNLRSDAAALIGFSFRVSAASMVTIADIINKSGYIISKDMKFYRYQSVDQIVYAAHRVSFVDYLNDLVVPALQSKDPNITLEGVVAATDLASIQEFLDSNTNIGVVTNRNEIILTKSDIAYLEATFADRLHVYPDGGHCGNVDHKVNVSDMVAFFKGGAK